MTAGERPISEEDLHGFVDGRLDPARHAAVAQHLSEDPAAAARIEGWQRGLVALQAAYRPAADAPVPSSLNVRRLMATRQARQWRPSRVAAGLVLALGVGAGAGWFAHDPAPAVGLAALGMQAAEVYRVFGADLVHPVEFSAEALPGQLGWIGERVGHAVVPPDLSGAGYRLLGARMVATPQGPGCVLLYDGGRLGRVSILMRSMRDADLDAPMRAIEAQGASGFAWARHGLGVSLVADGPLDALHSLSDRVREAMAAST